MIVNKIKQTNEELFINSSTTENIKVGDYVKFIHKDKEYPFEAIEVEVTVNGYEFTAIESGYFVENISYTNKIDLMDLIGLKLHTVTDKGEIIKIQNQSLWT